MSARGFFSSVEDVGRSTDVDFADLLADKGVDACMMIHPGGMEGATGMGGVVPTLAIQTIEVEFFGRTTHAGAAPWDGINALDAVNIAYSSISAMRQQMHTTDRVHGIITHGGDAPNSKCG